MTNLPFQQCRQQVADTAYEGYNFGAGVTLEDAGGWEHASSGNSWTRPVFVRTDEGDDFGSSAKLVFTVRFEPLTTIVAEAYAIDEKGQLCGTTQEALDNSSTVLRNAATSCSVGFNSAFDRSGLDAPKAANGLHHSECDCGGRGYFVGDTVSYAGPNGFKAFSAPQGRLVLIACAVTDAATDDQIVAAHGTERDTVYDIDKWGVLVVHPQVADLKEATLIRFGYKVGVRDPAVNPEFDGAFMVTDPADGEDGYAIVGNDRQALVREAYDHLDLGKNEPTTLMQARTAAVDGVGPVSQQSSVEVVGWDSSRYGGSKPLGETFEMDINDQRVTNGQFYVDVAPTSGHTDDIMGIVVEINQLPGSESHCQCAHLHFDGDNLAMSIFKEGNKYILRPETGVSIRETTLSNGEHAYILE